MGIGIGLGTGVVLGKGVVCPNRSCHRKVQKDGFNDPKECPYCGTELSRVSIIEKIEGQGNGYAKIVEERRKELLVPR